MMANAPKKAAGWLRFDNALVEILARANLSGRERRIIDVVLRKTVGWQKSCASISNAEYAGSTGLSKKVCSEIVNALAVKGVLLVEHAKPRSPAVVAINMHFQDWLVVQKLPKKRDTPVKGDTPEKRDNHSSPTGIRGIPVNGDLLKKRNSNTGKREAVPATATKEACITEEWLRLSEEERRNWAVAACGVERNVDSAQSRFIGKLLWMKARQEEQNNEKELAHDFTESEDEKRDRAEAEEEGDFASYFSIACQYSQ